MFKHIKLASTAAAAASAANVAYGTSAWQAQQAQINATQNPYVNPYIAPYGYCGYYSRVRRPTMRRRAFAEYWLHDWYVFAPLISSGGAAIIGV